MKKLNFIVQSKGGVGKSLFTYLIALSKADDPNTMFVDVDASTQTSTRQLIFLGKKRLGAISLLNGKEVLVRDQLVTYLDSLSKTSCTEIFLDFGAPESEQLPALIRKDIPFYDFVTALDFEVHFHVIVAGGGAYQASIDYLHKLQVALNGKCKITVWKNITSFGDFGQLDEELESNCEVVDLTLKEFGDFDPSSNLGTQILANIRNGLALDDYQIGPKFRMRKELITNFDYDK